MGYQSSRNPQTKNLIVCAEDTETGEIIEKEFDIIILSVILDPSTEISRLNKVLDLPIDQYGFLQEAYTKTNPIPIKADGIFVARVAHGPKNISDSIAEASAVAIKAVKYLRGGSNIAVEASLFIVGFNYRK